MPVHANAFESTPAQAASGGQGGALTVQSMDTEALIKCFLVAAGLAECLAAIGWMLAPYFQAEHSMDELRAAVAESIEGEDFPVIDWDKLQRQSPDICNWIVVPGTGIDYPVVAAPKDDPDY